MCLRKIRAGEGVWSETMENQFPRTTIKDQLFRLGDPPLSSLCQKVALDVDENKHDD